KVTHTGFQLWADVLSDDDERRAKAWRLMRRYQLGDIDVTDAVLTKMKPWIRILPNPALYAEDGTPEACGWATPGSSSAATATPSSLGTHGTSARARTAVARGCRAVS